MFASVPAEGTPWGVAERAGCASVVRWRRCAQPVLASEPKHRAVERPPQPAAVPDHDRPSPQARPSQESTDVERWWPSRSRLEPAHEIAGVHVEPGRESHDRAQAGVLKTTLEPRNFCHVKPGPVRELHLRQTRRRAEPPKVDPELLLRLHGQSSSER